MKSLFKRTLAAATGSVLALSQLAAMAATVNISAAETGAAASVTTIDKDYVLSVPVMEADPFQIIASDWNDRAETELIAMGTKTASVHAGKVRDRIIKRVKDVTFHLGEITDAQAKKLDACFSDAALTVTDDGKFKAVVEMSDIAPIIGEIFMDTLNRTDAAAADDGTALEPDFSGIVISGSFVLQGQINFDKKTVDTQVCFIDQNGNTYTDYSSMMQVGDFDQLGYVPAAMLSFVLSTMAAAQELADAGHAVTNYEYWSNEFIKHIANFGKDAYKSAVAVNEISVTGTDLNEVLAEYRAQLETKLAASKLSDDNKNRITKQLDYYAPTSVDQLFASERVNSIYDTYTEAFNKTIDRAEYALTLDDVQSVVESAISEEYAVVNGYSFAAKVKIDDDQKDELLTELIASGMTAKDVEDKYGYTIIIDGDETGIDKADLSTYEYVAVDSLKTIILDENTNDGGIHAELSYDVIRDVQAVHITAKAVTTTTT
ncbi:MAG: hypothetical protein MJ065_09030, partial [Oscillospiraceae bacterium]|nr:hypothetical protein [Oscillospiraceae bacterium]